MVDYYGRKIVLFLFLLGVLISDTWVKIVRKYVAPVERVVFLRS